MAWHPQSKYVEVMGRRAHVIDVGQGPPVLLVHGYLHSSWTWRFNVDALAVNHRVLVLDQMGLGQSARGPGDYSLEGLARFVDRVLERCGIDRLHAAIGHSLGGAVVASLALQAPERVSRLVLVGSAGLRFSVSKALAPLASPRIEPLFRWVAGRPAVARAYLRRFAYRRIRVDDAVLQGFLPGLRTPGTHFTAAEIARAMPRSTRALSRRFVDLDPPTLIVWGAHDGVIPLKAGHILADRIPDARLEVFEDCAHCPHEENPARFNRLMGDFLMTT